MLSIAIIDSNVEFAYVLAGYLRQVKKFHVPSVYQLTHEARRRFKKTCVDIVIIDLELKENNGIEFIKRMKDEFAETKWLVLSGRYDDNTVFDALDAGVDGYLLKDTNPEKISDALIELSKGGAPMSAAISCKLLKYFSTRRKQETKCKLLSIREKQVLQQVSRGLVYKEIGAALGIHRETVKKHVANICSKLNVQNKMEAINVFFSQ